MGVIRPCSSMSLFFYLKKALFRWPAILLGCLMVAAANSCKAMQEYQPKASDDPNIKQALAEMNDSFNVLKGDLEGMWQYQKNIDALKVLKRKAQQNQEKIQQKLNNSQSLYDAHSSGYSRGFNEIREQLPAWFWTVEKDTFLSRTIDQRKVSDTLALSFREFVRQKYCASAEPNFLLRMMYHGELEALQYSSYAFTLDKDNELQCCKQSSDQQAKWEKVKAKQRAQREESYSQYIASTALDHYNGTSGALPQGVQDPAKATMPQQVAYQRAWQDEQRISALLRQATSWGLRRKRSWRVLFTWLGTVPCQELHEGVQKLLFDDEYMFATLLHAAGQHAHATSNLTYRADILAFLTHLLTCATLGWAKPAEIIAIQKTIVQAKMADYPAQTAQEEPYDNSFYAFFAEIKVKVPAYLTQLGYPSLEPRQHVPFREAGSSDANTPLITNIVKEVRAMQQAQQRVHNRRIGLGLGAGVVVVAVLALLGWRFLHQVPKKAQRNSRVR